MSQDYRYNFTCPCGIVIGVDSYSLFEKLVAGHDFAHIERIIELKKPNPLPSLGMGGGMAGGVVVNNCGELHAIDVPRDGTVSQ